MNYSRLATGLRFPEGPVVLADGSVLCVEVMGGALIHIAADGAKRIVADLGGGPNGAARGPDGRIRPTSITSSIRNWMKPSTR